MGNNRATTTSLNRCLNYLVSIFCFVLHFAHAMIHTLAPTEKGRGDKLTSKLLRHIPTSRNDVRDTLRAAVQFSLRNLRSFINTFTVCKSPEILGAYCRMRCQSFKLLMRVWNVFSDVWNASLVLFVFVVYVKLQSNSLLCAFLHLGECGTFCASFYIRCPE